ncbi:MAG: acetylxylan esterase [Victivallales bacterium]
MEINLNRPYGLQTSPPAKPELAFYCENNRDLLFENGPIEIRCRAGIHSAGMNWNLARNFFKKAFLQGSAEAQPENVYVIRFSAEGLHPGFYDLRVILDTGDGKTVEGVCTFGFNVSQMPIRDSRPADFRAFWDRALAKLAALPLDPKSGEMKVFKGVEIDEYNLKSASLPGDYDPSGHRCNEVEACKIDFGSVNGRRIHAWLAKPLGDGPFPAMLVLPGGGFNSRPIPLEHARHGYLAIDIQIHGQEVDLKEYPQIPGYFKDFVYEPVEANYFHDMYLNAVQAVNYLLSRADVDKDRLAVVGGSQGGRTGVTTAALHPKVKATVPAIAHYGNLPYLRWAETCNSANPQKDGMELSGPPPLPDTPENRCCAYYDVMNFAQDVKCPTMINAGLVDPVSLASGVFAIYNRLGAVNKWMIPLPGLAHDWSAEFDRSAWRWLDEVWKNPAAAPKGVRGGSLKIVCLGDSITGKSDLSSYLKWSHIIELMLLPGAAESAVVVNRGIGGDTTAGVLKRLKSDVLDIRPDIVVLLIGGNDAGQKIPRETVEKNLDLIMGDIVSAGVKLLALQYHVIPNPENPETAWKYLDSNNDLVAAAAARSGAALLDMAAPMREAAKNRPVKELVNVRDGVHLNPGGELVFAAEVFKKLKALGWIPESSHRMTDGWMVR